MGDTYIEMLVRSKEKRAKALDFYEFSPNITYKEVAKEFNCSISYATQMIYKARKDRVKFPHQQGRRIMQDYTDELFIRDLRLELKRARKKSPSSDAVMTALTEEVGELAKAHMEEPWERVYKEAVQVACVAIRIAIEGDATLVRVRHDRGQDDGPFEGKI